MSTADERLNRLRRGAAPAAPVPAASPTGDGPEKQHLGATGQPARFTFDLDYQDRRGRRWRGTFQAHVLNVRERRESGILMADLLGGLSPAAVHGDVATMANVVSWLTLALDKPRPRWAEDLEALLDPQVVLAIYDEVASYEATFWGADRPGAGAGDDPGPSGAGSPGLDGAEPGGPPGAP